MKRVKKKKKKNEFTHNFCVHNPANWRWILGSCEQLPVPSCLETNVRCSYTWKQIADERKDERKNRKRNRPEKIKILYAHDGNAIVRTGATQLVVLATVQQANTGQNSSNARCTPTFFNHLPSHCSSFFLHRV